MNELKNAFVLKGLTIKQKAVVWWFSISLCLLCSTEDAPLWFLLLEVASLALSAHFLKKIPIPDYFKEDEE